MLLQEHIIRLQRLRVYPEAIIAREEIAVCILQLGKNPQARPRVHARRRRIADEGEGRLFVAGQHPPTEFENALIGLIKNGRPA